MTLETAGGSGQRDQLGGYGLRKINFVAHCTTDPANEYLQGEPLSERQDDGYRDCGENRWGWRRTGHALSAVVFFPPFPAAGTRAISGTLLPPSGCRPGVALIERFIDERKIRDDIAQNGLFQCRPYLIRRANSS